jgi:DNA-binding LytR/AlgR family response regulator
MNTNKIRCIIIEDEMMAVKLLTNYISRHDDLQLTTAYRNPVDYIRECDRTPCDLLFLDIMMPEMTGVGLLQTVSHTCEVIITSASQDYALDCYPLRVIDYLLKPFTFGRFTDAVDAAIETIRLKRNAQGLPATQRAHILLKVDRRLVKVKISDIRYVEAAWEYSKIYTADQSLMVLSQIKNLESELGVESFFRIHRSYLVNIEYITYVEGNQVCVGDVKLPVSRTVRAALLERLNTM